MSDPIVRRRRHHVRRGSEPAPADAARVVLRRRRCEPEGTTTRFQWGSGWRQGTLVVLTLLAAGPVWALGEAIAERYHEEIAVFVQQTRQHLDWTSAHAPDAAPSRPFVQSAPAVSHGTTSTFASTHASTWGTPFAARTQTSAPAAVTAHPSVSRPPAPSFPTFASLAPEGLRPQAARADRATTRASANPAPATTVNMTDFVIDTASNNSPYTLNTGDSITATDEVVVGNNGTGVLTQNGGTLTVKAGNTGFAGALYVAHASGSTGTYNLNGGSVNVDSFLIGGSDGNRGGNGTVVQTGGTVSVSSGLVVGYDAASTSSYSLSAGSVSSNYTIVGGYGKGTFTLSGTGTQTTGDLVLDAYASTGSGTYNLNGGTLTANDVSLGSTGTGTFNFNGGTLRAGASSTTFMQGLTAANVQATGAFIDTNGFNITINQALVHDPALGTSFDGGLVKYGAGTLTLTGVNTYTGGERVTAGTLAITAGSTGTSNSTGGVDGGAGGTAALTVSGTGTFVGGLDVGGTGNGVVTQSGGSTVTVSTGLFVGVDNGTGNTGLGTYNLQGGTLTTPTTYVGDSDNSAASVFNQTGGTHTINGALQFGHFNTNSAGTYNLDGGTLTANQIVQNAGTGTFNFNGGTLQAGQSDNPGAATNPTTFMTGLTTANVQAGGAIIDTNGFNVTVAQVLQHDTTPGAAATDGGLTKEGTGALTLTANNTINGQVEVGNGKLFVNNVPAAKGDSGTGSGAVYVDPSRVGTWLGGTGTIGGSTTVGSYPPFNAPTIVRGGASPRINLGMATLTPGAMVAGVSTPGILTFNGGLTLTSGTTTTELDLAGPNPGTGYDQVKVNGALTLGGTLTLTLGSGFEPTPGEKFYLIAYAGSAGISGTFDGLGQGAMVEDSAGNEYVINYADSLGNGAPGNDVSITFVPEPGTWAMLGLGMAALAIGLARRRVTA